MSFMAGAGTAVELPAFEIVGAPAAPVILALGGISSTRHVCRSAHHPEPGWWDAVAGPRQAIDTDRHRVLGVDFLDGGRAPDGRPARVVTTHDQADALASLLDEIDVTRLHAVVGASYGGMVALAFAERYPDRLERLIVVGAAHRAHPMAMARRVIQRRIVELGLESGRAVDALVLARALAMTTYRSDAEFAARFTAPDDLPRIDSYLQHHGRKFARRFSCERFLALSLSTDLHSVHPGLIQAPTTLVAAEHDAVVPRSQLEELQRALAGPSRLVDLASVHGHDAFLTDADALGVILRDSLDQHRS